MGVVTIVQARMSSTRLPGKVMLPLGEAPVLAEQVRRLRLSKLVGRLVVATTTDPADDAIAQLCRSLGVDCFRGHPTDCLDRHFHAATLFRATVVVKVPSDCPLVDPRALDAVVDEFLKRRGVIDYCSNLHPPTWIDGNDVEAISMTALREAWREAVEADEREHTTPFLWRRPDRFCLANVTMPAGVDHSRHYRLVLDYEEDYRAIVSVFGAMRDLGREYTVDDIARYLERHPEIVSLNGHWIGDSWMARSKGCGKGVATWTP